MLFELSVIAKDINETNADDKQLGLMRDKLWLSEFKYLYSPLVSPTSLKKH